MAKQVAVIGAGVAGLASIKNALDAGLQPTAYEKDSWFGGIWYYTEDKHRFVAPKSTVFNTSKHYSCFSDFPFPKETPNYTTLDDFQRYLESYAEKFDLTKRIRFNTEVLKVEKCQDYEETGRWEIHSKTSSDDNGKENVCIEEYDYVMVCSGVCAEPFVPDIAGIDDFTGTVIHSKSYKNYKPFEGRRVLVVGLGNTAGDIACELSRHAKQVYVSTRRGSYVVQRMAAHGVPSDLKFLNRVVQCLPKPLLMWLIKRRVSSLFNLSDLGLEPIGDESLSVILINDELPHRIVTGTLIMKDEIIGFKDKKVFFKDHTELDNIDDVIFATGFNVCASFLHKSVMNPDTAMSGHQSYKAVFPLGLSHPTLALIGFCRVAGSVIPVIEMQARFAMEVFKGDFILPSQDLMKKEVVERRAPFLKNDKKSASAGSYFLNEGFILYLDDIASLIGVKPNFWKLFLQDPKLALKCFFGPTVPAQYRLMGPGAWSGAKDVIEEVEESRLAPLAKRKGNNPSRRSSSSLVWIVCSVVVLLIAFLVFYK